MVRRPPGARPRGVLRGIPAGRALDVGSGSGGNSQVLADLGWAVTALEHSPAAAGLARSRGLHVVRGDARRCRSPTSPSTW